MYSKLGLFGLLTLLPGTFGKIDFLGVAIPGIDFGCDIDGTCPKDTETFPLTSLGGGDGEGQMQHFVKNDNMNVFRLPTSWQYITDGQGGDQLDSTKFGNYDKLVQTCLKTGAYCMLDLHNFARYDDGIIGQGGPTNDVFASLWSKIAKQYADDEKVIFGLMNEPHDVDIKIWAKTCQAAVTAIRKAGASSHMILLPGTNFASAETFVSTGSAEALASVSNPDGSKDGLLLDIHKYLDINNSGTHSECTTDNVKAFETIGNWLRKNKRKAMISESGASLDESCMEKFCTQNAYINDNSDVFIGFVSWGAGSFPQTYVLTLTPSGSAGSYTDNKLMTECVIAPFMKDSANNTETETTTSVSTKSKASSTKTSATVVLSTEGSVFKEVASTDVPAATQTEAPSNSSPDDNSGSSHSKGALMGLTAAIVFLFHLGLRFL